jgi:hypothetical protein
MLLVIPYMENIHMDLVEGVVEDQQEDLMLE